MSPALARLLDENGTASPTNAIDPDTLKPVRSEDKLRPRESLHRMMATNIYKSRDSRFYHVHGQWIHPAPYSRATFRVMSRFRRLTEMIRSW